MAENLAHDNAGSLQTDKLILGNIALSFHAASAAVLQKVLALLNHEVIVKDAPHEKMFEMLDNGEVDLLCSAWLPGSHAKYLNALRNEVEALTVLYHPFTLWGVPDYIPQDVLNTVQDLKKAEVKSRMHKVIQGIGPGAGISRFSVEIMQAYDLASDGYEFRNGSQQEMEHAFVKAVERQEWVVVPLWEPQHLHHTIKIRPLIEPNGLLRGKDEATLLIRKSALHKLSAQALNTLRNIYIGNAAMTELDYLINQQKLTPLAAAESWMKQNPARVEDWLNV